MSLPSPALLALLIVVLLPPLARSDLGAHYIKSPESITAPLGDEVEFPCQTNIAAERVAWRHRAAGGGWTDVSLPPAALTALTALGAGARAALRVTSKPTQSRLTVHLHNHSLAGDYRCISWYGVSALASVSARLVVAELGATPHLPDRRLQAAPGASVLVRCPPPRSEPPATILYYKLQGGTSIAITGGSEGVQEVGGAILVKARGQSTYTCEAINNLSGQTHLYHHKIVVDAQDGPPQAPTFAEDMAEEVQGVAGTAVWLGCGALGRPAPRLVWRRRGSAVPSGTADKGALLRITDLQPEDEGVYTCEANNVAGKAERSIRLSVLSAPSLAVAGGGGEVTASEGGEAKLPCGSASGRPAPTISWLINGKEVTKDSNVKILDSELEINPVEKRHAGVVQCFAANSLGSATTVNLLRVIPRQHAQMDGSEPGLGELGTIKPVTSGSSGKRHYKSKGHHNRTVMVPPSRPNVTRLTDESVMVRWSVEDNTGLRIEFFKVQYRDLSQGSGGRSPWNTSNQDIPPHVRSYEVNGLQPDHYYRFRIAAAYSNNDNKLGEKSSKFHLKRGAGLDQAPPAPLLTGAEPISPTEIKLHWQLPTVNTTAGKETPVEGYYVYYRLASSAGEYLKAYVEGGKAKSLVLRHLTPDASYEIKLQSFTPTAASDFSAIITKKTLKALVVEKATEVGSPSVGASGPMNKDTANDKGQVYLIAGGAAGGVAILGAAIIALVIYKKRKGGASDKQQEGGTGGELPNGFLPPSASPKPAITITANPLHPEGEDVDMEMSYISAQNNNCSSRSPRSSAEVVVTNSCRDDIRKQGAMSSAPTRENYV